MNSLTKSCETVLGETNDTTALLSGVQWCPDISPGSVQPENGTIPGVGQKRCFCLLGVFGLKKFIFFALVNANRQCHYKEILVR